MSLSQIEDGIFVITKPIEADVMCVHASGGGTYGWSRGDNKGILKDIISTTGLRLILIEGYAYEVW